MRALIIFALIFIAGCDSGPQSAAAGGQTPAVSTTGGSTPQGIPGRYGPGSLETSPQYCQGAEHIVGTWSMRTVFQEGGGTFRTDPASGTLELRSDATSSGPLISPLPASFDGNYTIKPGWLEFSSMPGERWGFIVTEDADAGAPVYVLKLSIGNVKLTLTRPRE